jgi:hypothetical protein
MEPPIVDTSANRTPLYPDETLNLVKCWSFPIINPCSGHLSILKHSICQSQKFCFNIEVPPYIQIDNLQIVTIFI